MKEYKFKINGKDYNASVEEQEDGIVNVNVNGVTHQVQVENVPVKPKAPAARVVKASAPAAAAPAVAAAPAAPAAGGDGQPLKSPLPGVVLDIFVHVGDAITTGQKVMLLEAMKMENNIEADKNGVVKAIKVNKGDSVQEGDVLILIA